MSYIISFFGFLTTFGLDFGFVGIKGILSKRLTKSFFCAMLEGPMGDKLNPVLLGFTRLVEEVLGHLGWEVIDEYLDGELIGVNLLC